MIPRACGKRGGEEMCVSPGGESSALPVIWKDHSCPILCPGFPISSPLSRAVPWRRGRSDL